MAGSASRGNSDASAAWQPPAHRLAEPALRALIAVEIPAIRLPNFATVDECRRLCRAIRDAADSGEAAITSPMRLIGCNFSNHGAGSKEDYFGLVEASYSKVGSLISAAGFDPLARMASRLRTIWTARVSTAEEPGFGRYFAGGIKTRTEGSWLHYDFTPHTAAGCAIGGIVDQLGWNLYLDLPANTGHTTTYNRPVPREGGRIGSGNALSLGLDRGWIDGAESFTFRPQIGEVVIINTRCPHEITMEHLAPGEWRVQISSFIGRLPDDELILWS